MSDHSTPLYPRVPAERRKQYNAKWYANNATKTYTCPYCDKTMKLVSRAAHEQTQIHTRAVVLTERFNNQPRLTPVVNDSVMTFALERDARNREETLLDREAQNAYRECYNRGLIPIITDTTVLA